MNIVLKTLGCRLNEAELQTWARGFQEKGHTIGRDVSSADLIVLNTCAVTQEAVRKSRKLIRKTHRNNPQAKLVVSGCYASLEKQLKTDIEGIDLIIPNQDKDKLVDISSDVLELPTMPSIATAPGEFSLFSPNRSRAFVKVQDGCRYRCTFCIVTVARGEERSRTIEDVIEEINLLQKSGVQEIVLTGVHIGGYGSDSDQSLYKLIDSALKETDIPRLRLGSVEPWDLPNDFFSLFDDPRFMPHLHLPLQSGSDSVLKRMARRCKTNDFRQLIEQARTEVKDIQITTDIIIGFPGETDEEWQSSLDYIESIGFSHIHIFSYSPREGTKAATLSDQVTSDIKKRRSQQLHTSANKMKKTALQDALGETLPILWESRTESDYEGSINYFGYTPNFLRVRKTVPTTIQLSNKITEEIPTDVSDCGEILFI